MSTGTVHATHRETAHDVAVTSLMEALYDLHRNRNHERLPQVILSAVRRIIRCDSALMVRVDIESQTATHVSSPEGLFAGIGRAQIDRLHRDHHPLAEHYRHQRDPRAWCLHDFVVPEVFRETPLYRQVYRLAGIEFQLIMMLPHPDRAPRVLVLNRSATSFMEWERDLLGMLWQHLVLAFRTVRSSARQRGLEELERIHGSRGVIVLDRTGKVDLCTEQARVWLIRYSGEGYLRGEIKVLPEPVGAWLRSAFEDRTLELRGIPDPVDPLLIRRGDTFLSLRLVADHGRGKHLVLMQESMMNSPPELLEGLGLTAREAEVLAWIAQGKTNRETGIILGLSVRTVQKHLERIFLKLGVETRTSAVLRAWQVSRFAALAAPAG